MELEMISLDELVILEEPVAPGGKFYGCGSWC